MVEPLKLKRQKSESKPVVLKDVNQSGYTAEVLVQTPVSFVDQIYSYLIPLELVQTAVVGSIVFVEYGRMKTKGLILSIESTSPTNKLKNILEVIGVPGMIDALTLNHFQAVRARFGGDLWNLIEAHLPPIPGKAKYLRKVQINSQIKGESQLLQQILSNSDFSEISQHATVRCAISQPQGLPAFALLIEVIALRARKGPVLILVGTFQDFDHIKILMEKNFSDSFISLDSRDGRAPRFNSFLEANDASIQIVLANRSGAFTRLPENASVIVVNDGDASHYEQRSPGWNSRDVTLLRSPDISLIFISAYHSLEISRLIDIKWLKSYAVKEPNNCSYHVLDGVQSYISIIRKNIKQGNVLVSVAGKGYANIFLCSKCKNMAVCECGGKLKIEKANADPICYLCKQIHKNWICTFCSNNRPFVIDRGIDRTAEEIGKAVPGARVAISKKEHLYEPSDEFSIIVSTRGCEPYINYAAVILLDCERIFNQPSLRAEEEAKHLWFDLIARVKNDGDVFISLQNNHPVTQQLLRRKNFNENDLNQRLESKLPPYFRCVVVRGSTKEISTFADNLRSQGRFLVSGPIEITVQISYIVIRFDYSEGSILVELLDDIVKVQGVKGRDIFDVRFDPYEL